MSTSIKCRECGEETETADDVLPAGWYFTKTDDEMAAPRGKPACPQCIHHFNVMIRRRLYED